MKTLIAILALAATAAAQPGKPNPQGWGPLTWEMSIAEARAALPAAVPSTEAPGPNDVLIDRLIVTGIPIGSLTAQAAIQTARDSDRVISVTVEAAGMNTSPARRAEIHAELKQLLIEKYGHPNDETRSATGDTTNHSALWIFPATSITLTWSETTPRYGLGYVTIRYRAIDRKALDIL